MNLFDRLLATLYRRGQSIVGAEDRIRDERRQAIREVRDAITKAMVGAEQDREHGADEQQRQAMEAAERAGALVHEVADETSRTAVAEWRSKFDAIPKGWKKGIDPFTDRARTPGYPEPAWSELKAAADTAREQLGRALRDLMG